MHQQRRRRRPPGWSRLHRSAVLLSRVIGASGQEAAGVLLSRERDTPAGYPSAPAADEVRKWRDASRDACSSSTARAKRGQSRLAHARAKQASLLSAQSGADGSDAGMRVASAKRVQAGQLVIELASAESARTVLRQAIEPSAAGLAWRCCSSVSKRSLGRRRLLAHLPRLTLAVDRSRGTETRLCAFLTC
jgi:hypothetical protein